MYYTIHYLRMLLVVLIFILCACSEKRNASNGEMILIPAGEFVMGSEETDVVGKSKEFGFIQPLYVDEHPRHIVYQKAFLIDKFEVTNGDFIKYFEDTQAGASREIIEKQMKEISNWLMLPVSQVTWYQAQEYCLWANKRLPSETEWEKASRGPQGLIYPWGNKWNSKNLNEGSSDSETGVAPAGSYPQGRSYYGVYDLAGNVAEWVADWYAMYPGNSYKSDFSGKSYKVVRGGGWGGVGHYVIPVLFRASHRDYEKPDRIFNDIGFRCARDVK